MPEFTFSENLFVCIVLVMAIGIGVLVVHGLMLALMGVERLIKKLGGDK